jgi:hypothetical protein
MYILKDWSGDNKYTLKLQTSDLRTTDYDVLKWIKDEDFCTDKGQIDRVEITDRYFDVGYDDCELIIYVEIGYSFMYDQE